MTLSPLKLCPVAASYPELEYTVIAEDIPDPSDHRRVRKLRAEIFVPEIGMGIEMDNAQLRLPSRRGTHRAESHQMLAAYHERELARAQYLLCSRLYIRKSQLRSPEAQLQIA